ncbi:MAG: binding domain protein excisionase family [Frankiales bacterium]|nr:binding domain protein excisionase family [Frankiales bacterium]
MSHLRSSRTCLWTTRPGGPAGVADSGAVPPPRFLLLSDVAEVLNISSSQTYALVRSGDLPAIKIGGRGQWRVEATVLEDYIARCYAETQAFVESHPLGSADG